jgi:6-pyruvoyltetrahydropterin/6-carboxytetrahydropterin synthase
MIDHVNVGGPWIEITTSGGTIPYVPSSSNPMQGAVRVVNGQQEVWTGTAWTAMQYKYTSTKEYHDSFPCAYRQWRADSHCNLIHGYAFSMKFYFGTDNLDVRNWAADYGGLKELKGILEDQFDHTLLVAQDDPELETFKLLQEKNMAKLTILPRLGCEGLADMLYKYVNGVYIPDMWGPAEAARLWCYRVEVRETQSNMAYREGHREWNEDLFT